MLKCKRVRSTSLTKYASSSMHDALIPKTLFPYIQRIKPLSVRGAVPKTKSMLSEPLARSSPCRTYARPLETSRLYSQMPLPWRLTRKLQCGAPLATKMYKFNATLEQGRITSNGDVLAATTRKFPGMLNAYFTRSIILLEGGKCSSRSSSACGRNFTNEEAAWPELDC